MTRPVYLLTFGLAVILGAAVAMVVVRSDEPVSQPEASSGPVTSISTAPEAGTPIRPTTTAATVSTTGGSPAPTTTVPTEPPAVTPTTTSVPEDEPGVDFGAGPVEVEDSAGRSAPGGKEPPAQAYEKGDDPLAQGGTGSDVTTSTVSDEGAVDVFEDPEAPVQKETTTTTSAGSTSGRATRADGRRLMYTWEDGDSTRQVWLDPGLVVKSGRVAGDLAEVVVETDPGARVGRGAGGAPDSGWPVFRSPSGALMTLPGGVLLVLDPEWSEAQTKAFFSRNRIKQARVSELGYLTNGFFVETEPGLPSLELANRLAAQAGVELSSPNWWTESSTR